MGNSLFNCKCNCNENQGASFIIQEISDDYYPIKRKKNSMIKNVNSLFCSTCKRDSENKYELNISKSKIIPLNSNNYESSINSYNKQILLGSNNSSLTNKEETIKNIKLFYRQKFLNNLDEELNDGLSLEISYIVLLQSIIRGWLYREHYILSIKNELINKENNLIEKSKKEFTNKNIKLSEEIYGLFNKESWKQFYKEGESLFSKEAKKFIFEKYNLKKQINNFNFNFKPKVNPDFLIENFDDDEQNGDKKYEILDTIFHNPSNCLKNTFFCKLKLSSLFQETMYIGSVNIEGDRQGYGQLTQKNGLRIEGFWKEGILNGWGRVTNEDGQFFEGYFINGKINGRGIRNNLDGYIYTGEFFLGMKEGYGKEENNKIIYEGDFHKDLKCGKGFLLFKLLEDKYEGEFENNVINGNGFYEWKNGNSFKGNFTNGKMNGIGLFKWKDGSKYYGNYKNNIKEGKGKFIWPNGKSFEGIFLNGKPNGKGILTLVDENKKVISSNEVEYMDGKLLK